MERTAALALIGLGVDAVYAEEIARTLSANNLDTATLDGIHWWSSQRWHLDPVAAIQEARIGWWVSPAIDFQYKRLLDTRFEGEPTDAGPPGPRGFDPVVVWDGGTDRLVDQAKSLLPVAQAMLQRQWAEAWRQWPRFSMEPDISPVLPVFKSLKGLIDFYEHVRPHGHDPAHPAHVLRIFLDALYASKAWDEAAHPRHRAGTSEGGRFAPKRTGTSDADRSLNYEEYMRVLRAEHGEDATERVHFDAVREKAGERDAYPPALWPALPPAAEAELNAFEQDISFETIERAQIYDAGGTLISEAVGDTTSVGMAIPRQFMPGIINTHNHPNLSPPSGEDIVVGIQYGAQEFRAVSGEYVYVAKLPVVADEQNRAALARTVYDAWQQVEKDARSDLQGYIDSGDISVAMAVHVYPELVSARFADEIDRHGITIERKRLIPDRKLTADEAGAVDAAWREGISGFYSTDGGEFVGGPRAARAVKDSKIAIYRTQSNNSGRAGRFTDESMSGGFFELATQRGATNIYTVSDTRLSRLYLKRQLSSEERKAVGDAFGAAVTRYTDYARERVGDSVGERLGAIDNAETNRIRDVAWRDTAAKYPKLIEYHAGWIPSFDPRELAESGKWKPGDNAGLPLKAWDEAAHPRHRAGTPVDPATGAGGGRFAPKESSAPAKPAGQIIDVALPRGYEIARRLQDKAEEEGRNFIAVDEWPELPKRAQDAMDNFAKLRRYDAMESAVSFDASGYVYFRRDGGFDFVDVNGMPVYLGAVYVHNHPSLTSSLSENDVMVAAQWGMHRIDAVSGDHIWSMELPVYLNESDREKFVATIDAATKAARARMDKILLPLMDKGEMSVADANELSGELQWKFFMEDFGEGAGMKMSRRRLPSDQEPSQEIADALRLAEDYRPQNERQADYTTQYLLDGRLVRGTHDPAVIADGDNKRRIGLYVDLPTDGMTANHSDPAVDGRFADYAKNGATTVLFVGNRMFSQLDIKRKLTNKELDGLAAEFDLLMENERFGVMSKAANIPTVLYTEDSTARWIAERSKFAMRAKAWTEMARRHPDTLDFNAGFLPGHDPVIVITDPVYDTRGTGNAWVSLKTWNADAHPRYPAGIAIDDSTGVGGGRFAPKGTSAAPAAPAPSAFDIYAAALEKSRREHRNKIMPDEWPPMPPEVKAKIVKFAQSITWDGTETVQVYDAAGNPIGHGTGDHEGVNIPDIESFTPGAVVVHNHPNMSGISIDDVEQAILQGARELWATNGDYAWVMELPVVPDAYNRMSFRNDAASYLEQLMRMTKSLVAGRLDAGEIDVPEANHLRTSMGDRLFVDRWGGERGFGVRVERLWPERKLTPDELALVEKVHDQDESTGMHDLGNGKAAVYRAPKTDRLALTYYAKGFAPDTLRYAVEHGADTVIGVSDARVSRLYIKRKLTGAEVDGIASTWTDTVKKEYETSERRVIAHGNDRSKVWPIIDQYAGSNFRAKGWRAAADKYPDAIEYHDSWLPRLDPEELMKTDDWRKTREAAKAWDEAAHPRHRAGTPVDDSTGAGGGRFAPKDSNTPGPAGDTNTGEGSADSDVPRVWSGEKHQQPDKVPSKQLVGELGENLVRQIMTDLVGEKFRTLNDGRSNAPIDLFGDHMAIEVKAGLASNRHDSRKWRATIGEPGKAEKELLAQMTPEEKLKHNDWKREEILRRKADLADQLSAHTPDGKPVEQVTVGLIFKPDLTAVDVYVIDGYHLTLRWSQYATDEHYLDTYKVDPQWPKN